MLTFASRRGRVPLALNLIALGALAALAACSDEPVAPKTKAATPLATKTPTLGPTLNVTNTSGGLEPGSFRWAAKQIETGGGGTIVFDSALGGKTITLDDGIAIVGVGQTFILGPSKGVTISGKGQFRLMHVNRLTMENVTLTKGNGQFGSAIDAYDLVLKNSTVEGNSSTSSAVFAGDNLTLINSTVSGNTTAGPAVEYGRTAQVLIDNSTIAFNTSVGLGPYLIPTSLLRVTLRNSILSNNAQNCGNYYGFAYEGTNVVNDWTCADVAITPSDPLLLPLANNGGPTMTHAIPFNSPAFNKGVNCSVDVDQRYVPRDTKCDVGAFEFNDFTNVTIAIDPNVKVDAANGRALLTGTIKCSRDETLKVALELHQDQKVGKQVVDVHSAATPELTCGPTAKSWAQKMILTEGAWQTGAAKATAQTYQVPEWVTSTSAASAVKIAITRK